MKSFVLNGDNLTLENSIEIIEKNIKISISNDAKKKILKSRKLVEKWIQKEEIIYGINTGFGEFKDIIISQDNTAELQKNLIISHSAGVGELIPDDIVRLMMLFRINSLIKGYSGVRLELITFLLDFFNSNMIPQIPSQGSVGCSGDLAPLAHLAATFLGYGKIKIKDISYDSKVALKKIGLKPFTLAAKEGLALINGTQMMTAYLCKSLEAAISLSKLADISASFTIEGTRSTDAAYDIKIQKIRPHLGQILTSKNLKNILEDSEIMKSHEVCNKVQDAYSIRCIPQVHGAVKDTIKYCKNILEIEINSVTDNPLIYAETEEHLEGGNFHGEPIAFASDFLKIAIAELGSISERRIARIVDGNLSGLPRFLTKKGGINSGLMIAQYTAASLVSENKVISHPASVDSIPTSANQEDHNSMGSIASRKCYEVINNVKNIIAIEILCGLQALNFVSPLKPGKGVLIAFNILSKNFKFIENDIYLSDEIKKVKNEIFKRTFLERIEKSIGKINY